jgi:integrase
MTGVVRPSAHKKELEFIQPDGYKKYLNRVQGTLYYAVGVFAARCGCRRGEQLALQWADINPKSGVVTISKSVLETKAGPDIKVPKFPVVLGYRGDRTIRYSSSVVFTAATKESSLPMVASTSLQSLSA